MKQYSKILVLGRSGSGKTSSLRRLNPKTTGIINTDKKQLPFPEEQYETVLTNDNIDFTKSNYVETSKPSSVIKTLEEWEKRSDIEVIILDTITHLMTAYYITDALGKEYGGYKQMGTSFWNIIDKIRNLKKDVIVFGHINYEFNDDGDRVIEMRTHGNMIKQFEPASYFSILLTSEVIMIEGEMSWVFRTVPKNPSEAVKSPAKFNSDGTVTKPLLENEPNDVRAIFDKLSKFYNS